MTIRRPERPKYPHYLRDEFAKDIDRHTMTVERDDGLHRHLRCRRLNEGVYAFQIVTMPGLLTITGDMGTYVFARIADMFQFFRQPNGRALINPSYWAQKLLATSVSGGHERCCEFAVRSAVAAESRSLRDRGASNEAVRDFIETATSEDVTGHEQLFYAAVYGWRFDKWLIDAPWDRSVLGYTHQFLWCLHAIVWAIQQYDASRVSVAAGATA